jgi:hypothetical protein
VRLEKYWNKFFQIPRRKGSLFLTTWLAPAHHFLGRANQGSPLNFSSVGKTFIDITTSLFVGRGIVGIDKG